MGGSVRIALIVSLALSAGVHAQDFQIGDVAECSGNVGTIVRIDPRPGWDEPFYVVETKGAATTYEFKCVPSELRKIGARAASAPTAPSPASSQSASSSTNECVDGAKLEGQWGISWYEATVLAAPDANGKCRVHFDGYGSEWDTLLGESQLRARGSGPVTRPVNPVAEAQPAEGGGAASADIPDGEYRCSKISPGSQQLMSVGTLTVRGGQGTLAGMPEGWTVRSISSRGRNSRGELVVALDYRSASGFNDRLDCIAP